MSTFHEFLLERFEAGGFSTDDALASFVPLARDVAKLHGVGKTAPLEGVGALQVEHGTIYFPASAVVEAVTNAEQIRLLDPPDGAIEVVDRHKRTLTVESGNAVLKNLGIGSRDEEPAAPVYLPGYVSWEQLVHHHDPLTDIFALGMILASLACGLDFNQPDDLAEFVSNRRNLFALVPNLHPVLAKAIVRMTELRRRHRPQDLAALVETLAHYREQSVDVEFVLSSATPAGTKKGVILSTLRNRLFEVSRRNKLLHFRASAQDLNLTQASAPLSLHVETIKPDELLTWQGDFQKAISRGEAVSLNRYLNFTEQLYVPSTLDRLRADAARDIAEYGFEQLRLALCFLSWSDLKANPPERYDSPLVLLPVKLIKKKGVRDSYFLHPGGTVTEVNPMLRHLFAQLYDIALPASIDLAATTLDAFYDTLAAAVAASEPAVTITKVSRPRIDLVHDLAKRRSERYRRSSRVSGRGVRSFGSVDYSYDAGNFHPLGLALYNARIRPQEAHLRAIVQDKPAAKQFAIAAADDGTEKEKSFFSWRESGDANPYQWEFDLCRLTLGNFRYRKMTLVRDYAELAEEDVENPAFDAVFSLVPRPFEALVRPIEPLESRYAVVSSDPTQTAAIGLAREGTSYIVQGPPGTGKSQTITNLIADYVVRGKSVLFVCEKRAAIDVVFERLKQRGLHQLCCLIHDSQGDKKEYFADLKVTYEAHLAARENDPTLWERRRSAVIDAMRAELTPLETFGEVMSSRPEFGTSTVRELLTRAIALPRAALTPEQRSSLPGYSEWLAHVETIEQLTVAIASIRGDAILAHHPLRQIDASALQDERPADAVAAGVRTALRLLPELLRSLRDAALAPDVFDRLATVLPLLTVCERASALCRLDLLALLDDRSAKSARYREARAEQSQRIAERTEARSATRHWRKKFSPSDLAVVLERVVALEASPLRFVNPAWWQARKAVSEAYDFGAHPVAPSISNVLRGLEREYAAEASLAKTLADAVAFLHSPESLDTLAEHIAGVEEALALAPGTTAPAFAALIRDERSRELITTLAGALSGAQQIGSACAVVRGARVRTFDALLDDLQTIERSIDVLPEFTFCLMKLAALPLRIADAFRDLPVTPAELEGEVLDRHLESILGGDPFLRRFDGAVRDSHTRRLAALARTWNEANASTVLERAHQRFAEQLRRSNRSATGLAATEREFKAAFMRGRRELEHEFGKVMRHKSIRDLVAGDSGLVIGGLKPVWLMSPLSVCDTLPLRVDQFDVVIFDEASQITLEEAVPAIFRARQAIVVGDEMQLPPTSFFAARPDIADEEERVVGDDGEVHDYDLSANSFLNHAAKNLTSRMLGWHYRSRSESLIAFSNAAFYEGKLLTVPDAGAIAVPAAAISGDASSSSAERAAQVLDRPMSFHYLPGGTYENRRNPTEANYIATLVRGLLSAEDHPSIGIIAFSEAQQTEIEAALDRLADSDRSFRAALDAEAGREIDGQFAGLLVKNLENIQGDERDVIILSVCYGYDPNGKMRMNFGPINQNGGEKRLNVAFSRAKHHMTIVTSFLPAAITNEYNDGANALKSYLKYAQAVSTGDRRAALRILRELSAWRSNTDPIVPVANPVVDQIAAECERLGYVVEKNVGLSHFRCDLAVRRHGDVAYRAGVFVDTESHYRQADVLEREMLRPQLMHAFGWTVAHVLTLDWYRDRDAVVKRLADLVERGIADVSDESDDDEDPWGAFDSEPAGIASAESQADAQDAPAVDVPEAAAAGSVRYFEFKRDASAKFWELAVTGSSINVRFGRIGTNGQLQTKAFASAELATAAARRLVSEKLGKGYVEVATPEGGG